MDKLMLWLLPKGHAFAQFMGRGKKKVVTLYLWPFTSFALFVVILLIVDAIRRLA